jgi:DNA-directed RNA polymerase subunit RPC12/RpoP
MPEKSKTLCPYCGHDHFEYDFISAKNVNARADQTQLFNVVKCSRCLKPVPVIPYYKELEDILSAVKHP